MPPLAPLLLLLLAGLLGLLGLGRGLAFGLAVRGAGAGRLGLGRGLLRRPGGAVQGLFLAEDRRAAPRACLALEFVEGRGVRAAGGRGGRAGAWDRYAAGAGSYSHRPEPGRQVTLVSTAGCRAAGITAEQSRRNVAVSLPAAELNSCVGREVRLGPEVVLFAHRRTVPCAPLARRLGRPGLVEDLLDAGGMSCEILRGGRVSLGQAVRVDLGRPPSSDRIRTPGWTPEKFVRPSLRSKLELKD